MLVNILMATFVFGVAAVSAGQLILTKAKGDKKIEQTGELEDLRRYVRIRSSYINTSSIWTSGLCANDYIEVRTCGNQTLINKFPTQTQIGSWLVRAKCESSDPTKLIVEYSNANGPANWINLFASVPFIYGSDDSTPIKATGSLYYRFDQSAGPYGEAGLTYQPEIIGLANDTTRVHFKSIVGMWTEGGSATYDARGAPRVCDNYYDRSVTVDPRYIRSNIGQVAQTFPCMAVIGMWTDGTATPGAGLLTPFLIGGVTPGVFAKPPLARELVIAFNDGYQWNNNSGSLAAEMVYDTCVE